MTMSVRWDANSRPQKDQVRSAFLRGLRTKRSTLFLPGNECLCVREAVQQGVIGPHTMVHAVERDPVTAAVIRTTLDDLGCSYNLFQGELADYVPHVPLDYALVDLMGPFDENTARWLRQIVQHHTAPGFSLGIVVSMNWRNSDFMRQMHRDLRANHAGMMNALSEEHGITSQYALTYIATLHRIFHEFSFDLKWTIRYRDSRITMLAFRLVKFEKLVNGSLWTDFSMMDDAKVKPKRPPVTKDPIPAISPRSLAALKAWQTRRENGWVHPAYQ